MPHITIKQPRYVQFNGSRILATKKDGQEYVAIKPICEALGLDWSAQLQRMKRDVVLSETMVVITTVTKTGDNLRQQQAMINIHKKLEALPR